MGIQKTLSQIMNALRILCLMVLVGYMSAGLIKLPSAICKPAKKIGYLIANGVTKCAKKIWFTSKRITKKKQHQKLSQQQRLSQHQRLSQQQNQRRAVRSQQQNQRRAVRKEPRKEERKEPRKEARKEPRKEARKEARKVEKSRSTSKSRSPKNKRRVWQERSSISC